MALHATERVSDPDALVAICIDTIRLAVIDLRRGPGSTRKQQQAYASAVAFLQRTRLLALVEEHYGMVGDDAEALIDDVYS
jgi:hypothetical protein